MTRPDPCSKIHMRILDHDSPLQPACTPAPALQPGTASIHAGATAYGIHDSATACTAAVAYRSIHRALLRSGRLIGCPDGCGASWVPGQAWRLAGCSPSSATRHTYTPVAARLTTQIQETGSRSRSRSQLSYFHREHPTPNLLRLGVPYLALAGPIYPYPDPEIQIHATLLDPEPDSYVSHLAGPRCGPRRAARRGGLPPPPQLPASG